MGNTVLLFGCLRQAGHYMYHPIEGSLGRVDVLDTPWGYKLDGGLCPDQNGNKCQTGRTAFHQQDGWSAVSFWDQSVDSRPACNTTFLTHALVTEDELLTEAREQWPEVFSRPRFPLADPSLAR